MPEQRGRQHHQERLAEALREEIGAMLAGELADPRLNGGYVSEVVLAAGGKSARVMVQVQGGEEAERQLLEGLAAARGHIRHELLDRLGVRHVPELTFHIDRSTVYQARIDELLGRTKRRQRP